MRIFTASAAFVFIAFGIAATANAATLTLQPLNGSFSVGSTFNAQILLDTEGKIINAVDVRLRFPADKLQVVSPTVGTSIIGVWASAPKFDNAQGIISFQGGIPDGISASRGLVSTVTFRVKGVGSAAVRFGDSSRVLLHDGRGTDVLRNTFGAVYNLVLPAPAGPDVASETHPNQDQWYSNSSVALRWDSTISARDFSYTLNQSPLFTPENIVSSSQNSVIYRNLASGQHYFHIKAMNADGMWGGVTHFAINVDVDSPAVFPIEIRPGKRTASKDVLFSFETTDAHSGVDHYEYKVIPLNPVKDGESLFFIEGISPQVLKLALGSYDFVVRAYDRAGNFREVQERVKMMSLPMYYATNVYFLVFLVLLLGVAAYFARKFYSHHLEIERRGIDKTLPSDIGAKLKELQKYKSKYGALSLLLVAFLGYGVFGTGQPVYAQSFELSPPLVTTFPKNISNEEIFYMGGNSEAQNVEILIYLQNLRTNETFSYSEISGKNGEWFYRHPSFLSPGDYLVWTQSKLGNITSPPSPQINLSVTKTAIQFGSSRVSHETLYLILSILLLIALMTVSSFAVVYGRKVIRSRRSLAKEIREAEEAIRVGFNELRHDIEVELGIIKKLKLSKDLSREEKEKEGHLLRDLSEIKKHISKEVYDIEKIAGGGV